jgi:putative heme-binding domain-containing protein
MTILRCSDKPAFRRVVSSAFAIAILISGFASATRVASAVDGKKSPAAPFLALLKSGKLPQERVGLVVEMACTKGEPDDLAYIFAQAADDKAWNMATRVKALELLADAAEIRKVKPTGDLSSLKTILLPTAAPTGDEAALQLKAVRLAGLWKDPKLAADLQKLAISSKAGSPLQNAVVDSLGAIGGAEAKDTLLKVAAKGQPQKLRYRAVAALAQFDLDSASKAAAEALADGKATDDFAPVLDQFLSRPEGLPKLSTALAGVKLNEDVAKRALSYMFSIGHSDPALSDVLSKAAGLPANPPERSEQEREAEVQKLLPEVTAKGDPKHGEEIFRRADISCMRCHSVVKAGGEVGPELSAVGKTSPLEYIVRSILNPSAQIKEEFETRIFIANGVQYMGIVKGRHDGLIDLRDASGKNITLAEADLDAPERTGRSMMPEGLTKFLTHQELLDLAAFVNQLGKPGQFEIRVEPTIQRWRVLRNMPAKYATDLPNVDQFRDDILASKPEDWAAVYAKVIGILPVTDIQNVYVHSQDGGPSPFVYIQGEVLVTKAGKVTFKIDAPAGTVAWLDAEPYEGDAVQKITANLKPDTHKLTLRVPVGSGEKLGDIKVELQKQAGSPAQFQPVGGP